MITKLKKKCLTCQSKERVFMTGMSTIQDKLLKESTFQLKKKNLYMFDKKSNTVKIIPE